MTLTLLIDLDDTLLSNDVNQFLDQYFQDLSNVLSPFVEPDKMMQAMTSAIRAMVTKMDPAGTMEDTFDQSFYPGIGVRKADLLEILDDFYRVRFPRLGSLTVRRPDAIQLIEKSFHHGWQVVIATNPLFPATAIHQRLAWAGLPPEKYPFAWITNYETSHFCKPNPAFYTEILSLVCWPESPVVMVGNDLKADIEPAEAIGLPTYWLCENNQSKEIPNRHPASRQGSFTQLEAWLEWIEQKNHLPDYDTTTAIKATLAATPAALSTLMTQLSGVQWNQRPIKNEWSITEIICHLRDVDREVNIQRIQTVLDGSNPFIPGAVTDPWVKERNYASECGSEALIDFMNIRTEILHLLDSMDSGDWQKTARHAIFGPTHLKELANFIATHDRAHIKQVWQTLQMVITET